ncbi:hypothetical protein [Nonomuraea dietziae]|uniref:hypothetical protein n=1 Tax=Nonomuraea dietziae TaxID=65515 RepID=UPI0033E02DAC
MTFTIERRPYGPVARGAAFTVSDLFDRARLRDTTAGAEAAFVGCAFTGKVSGVSPRRGPCASSP